MTQLQLKPYQEEAIEHIVTHPRSAVWCPMGGGKTAADLNAFDRLRLTGDVERQLVVAPLRVARSTWPKECKIWTPQLSCQFIGGEGSAARDLTTSTADLVTINFEQVPTLIQQYLEKKKRWPFQKITVDESSKLRGYRHNKGTRRAGMLMKAAFASTHFTELTGTPSPNGMKNLWGQLYYLDRGVRLGRTMEAFTQRWFRPPSYGEYGPQILPHAQEQIQQAVSDICISIDLAKYFDVRDPFYNDIEVELPPAARAAYKEMEKKFFAELKDGKSIEALSAAAKSNKLLQLATGAVYTDKEGTYSVVHDAKLDALEEIYEEAEGNPLLVVYQYRHGLERLLKRFPMARTLKTDKDEDDFNAGRIPMLVVHPASAGHGLSLHHACHHMVLYGLTWDLELYQQVLERIGPIRQAQGGYNRPVFVHRIIATRTLDEVVLERLKTKRGVQDLLLEAVRRHYAVGR